MDFKERCDKPTHQQSLELINKLEQLTQFEAELSGKIKSIYDSVRGGGFMSGGALTLVEDEDDAKVASMGQRRRLRETQEEIQYRLKKAIELGMHKEDLRLELKPGFVVEVPRYISGLCEKYKVETE